jgi:hypothetical protein
VFQLRNIRLRPFEMSRLPDEDGAVWHRPGHWYLDIEQVRTIQRTWKGHRQTHYRVKKLRQPTDE